MRINLNNNRVALVLQFGMLILTYFLVMKPFDKDVLNVRCEKTLNISHSWGVVTFSQFINVRNLGEKMGTITKIEGIVKSLDGGSFKKRLVVKTYGSQGELWPLLEIPLRSNNFFNYQIQLLEMPDWKVFDEITKLQSEKVDDYEYLQKTFYSKDSIPAHVTRFLEKKIHNFICPKLEELQEGQYGYLIAFTKNNESTPFHIECYTFSLHQPHIFQLKETVKDYARFDQYVSRPNIHLFLSPTRELNVVNPLKKELGY